MVDKAANLRSFFAAPDNTVTRERIFFNRLSFDLKIAAARAGYHLHLYEPDVDRDGFDVFAEDPETGKVWLQTKAVLSSAGTASWDILGDMLRPSIGAAESYGWAPVEAGRGGGVVLIEIDDETSDGGVVYRYTDFDIITAIAEGYLLEVPYAGRGRPAKAARQEAEEFIRLLKNRDRGVKLALPKKLFVTAAGPDDLLGLTGLLSENGYGMYATRTAYRAVGIDANGRSTPNQAANETAALHHHMGLLCAAQPGAQGPRKVTTFRPFEFVPATPPANHPSK